MVFAPETVWQFSIADSITFGVGASAELEAICQSRGAEHVLVVTDTGIAEAGILDLVVDQIESVAVDVFTDVEPDPSLETFETAVDRTRSVAPDLVIGLGGGSAMDVAKTAGVIAHHGGDVIEYVAAPTGAGRPVPGPGIPTVAVPTTSGTGSETTPVAVISLPDEDLKAGISTPHQRPVEAVVDPALTVTLPPGPTAASGIDALSHAIEAFTTRRYDAKPAPATRAERPTYNGRTVLTDALAAESIALIATSLRNAVDNGEDLDARRSMSLGSLLAGMAFSNAGLGVTHAIAMATGAVKHSPHGVTIAHVLPAVMEYNATSASEQYGTVAQALGVSIEGLDRSELGRAAAEAVEKLAADVGIDGGLRSIGVEESDITYLADRSARLERLTVGNPRRVDTDALEEIIRNAL